VKEPTKESSASRKDLSHSPACSWNHEIVTCLARENLKAGMYAETPQMKTSILYVGSIIMLPRIFPCPSIAMRISDCAGGTTSSNRDGMSTWHQGMAYPARMKRIARTAATLEIQSLSPMRRDSSRRDITVTVKSPIAQVDRSEQLCKHNSKQSQQEPSRPIDRSVRSQTLLRF